MNYITKGTFIICLSLHLLSCSVYQNSDVGKVVGTIGGGLLGSPIGEGNGKVLAVGTGMVGGYILGDAIGYAIDYPLSRKLYSALFYNQPNQTSTWVSRAGTRYILTPTSDLMNVNDVPGCRLYKLKIITPNCQIHEERGVVCVQLDQTWAVLTRTICPGKGVYRDLVRYNKLIDLLETNSPARQLLPDVNTL